MSEAPFSARNKGAHCQIDKEFPGSARNALLHLLLDLVEREYVTSWIPISRELQRIGRCPPKEYARSNFSHLQTTKKNTQHNHVDLEWDKVYDFCERLH